MSMSVKKFQTHVMPISDDVNDGNEKSCQVWIVPARVNPARYINDLRYLEGERSPRIVREANGKTQSYSWYKICF